MTEIPDITWATGKPCALLDKQIVTYHEPVLDAKGKVVGAKPWSFTVASCRPATAEEVEAWRAQP